MKISVVDALEKITNKLKEELGSDSLSEVNDAVGVFGNATVVIKRSEDDPNHIDVAIIGGKPYEFEEDLDVFENLPESEDIANG